MKEHDRRLGGRKGVGRAIAWMPLVAGLLGPADLGAHDLWVVPGKFHLQPGERSRVFINSGDEFPKSDSLVGEHRIALFQLITAAGTVPLEGFVVDGRSLTAEVSVPQGGTAVLALSIRPRLARLKSDEFNLYLKEDGLTEALALREQLGETDQPAVERYSKWAKAILRVGQAGDPTWAASAGLGLEMIPEKDPYDLKPGDLLPVVVLYNGLPAASLLVSGGRAGGPPNEVRGTTDLQGRVSLLLPEPGRWFLRGVHMIRLEGDPQARWESHWTTLTFEMYQ